MGLGKNPSWEAFQPDPFQHGPIPKPSKKFLVIDLTYNISIGLGKNQSWEAFQPDPFQHGPIPKPTKNFLVIDLVL